MNCICGHSRHVHNLHEGCIQFLCCTKTRNLTPGKRHTEHDGADHQALPCRCLGFDAVEEIA